MKTASWIRIVLLVLAMSLVACGGGEVSFSTANIADAHMAKDADGAQATSTFAPDDTFYLLVDLANATDGTKVKAAWTAVSVEGADPNTHLDDVELTSGSGTLTFDLKNDGSWPAGDYKVDVYLNDELDRTLTFKVSNGLAQTSEEAVPTTSEATPETAVASGAVNTLEDVKTAVIQIEAQGTFRDPEVGTIYNAAGRGSGFIIDPSGIAVTNNHVVTGAALIKVWVGGESEPRNARILGVSECADLAVIDIDGEGYPYMEWYGGNVDVGLDVYAAGFPLGDPEYTLTRGIISKANANGETDWASVDGVVQHDATINPGNSGGALVTPDGKLVAVNYAGAAGVDQYFAIAQAQALPVIEELRQGRDYLSIGVNGRAVNNGEGLSGIWVSSVKSGSPADKAGVAGGDIITRIEGLVLAVDGTMSDYCDILRTHNADDALSLEVLRFDTQEVLEGQLNGDSLTQSYSFAQEVAADAGAAPTDESAASGAGYSGYVAISDNSGAMQMSVPAEWNDVDGSAWALDGETIGLSLSASSNLNALYNGWDTPGVFFGATDQFDLTVDALLDNFDYTGQCAYDGRSPYQDDVYAGQYDFWYDCGGNGGAMMLALAVQPADGSYLGLVLIQMLSQADIDAADQILASFIVN
ncbi:MAG: serine protease [Ardenticatenaceae bacterium]|nr:serine protease [Anaerolineales bacterium]MCB8921306.1 serine protease [Ardenticatenaceae bacterium]MCB8990672.1 serine protease [Ardenticatenaceae bacterium]MCB9004069.1 serine protease [Ardenticatenaceae bacterium]